VQVHLEEQARKAFRADIKAAITADLAAAPPPGEVVDDEHSIADKTETATTNGVTRMNKALGAADATGVLVNLYLTPAQTGFSGAITAIIGGTIKSMSAPTAIMTMPPHIRPCPVLYS
jgi:hypothetical protein